MKNRVENHANKTIPIYHSYKNMCEKSPKFGILIFGISLLRLRPGRFREFGKVTHIYELHPDGWRNINISRGCSRER